MGTRDLGVGLALSGGGFRATLFHLGSLIRLNELGWLRKLDMVTSVSGGSIIAGVLARNWNALAWESTEHGFVARNLRDQVEQPIRDFCTRTIDVTAGLLGGLSPFSSIGDAVARAYDEHLFHGARLQDLPPAESGATPRFVFYATNLQTGSGVRISRKYLADYKLGQVERPDLPLARVVCASSAFPPVLSPVYFDFEDTSVWNDPGGAILHSREDLKRRLVLTDGGVYDNMGLEAIWRRCQTVLASDAGAPLDLEEAAPADPIAQMGRVRDILIEQTRALRKRMLVEALQRGDMRGTYWGIATCIGDYGLADALVTDGDATAALKKMRTRLNRFSPQEQGQLINWGYALTDAAMRRWVVPQASADPGRLPDAQWPL